MSGSLHSYDLSSSITPSTAVLTGPDIDLDQWPNHEAPDLTAWVDEDDNPNHEAPDDRADYALNAQFSALASSRMLQYRERLGRHQIDVLPQRLAVIETTATDELVTDEAEGVDDGDGRLAPPLSGWPFYQSHRLAAAPNDGVIITQGEEDAEFVDELITDDFAAIYFPKDGNPEDFDCEPLMGRDVYLWLPIGSPALTSLARRVTAAGAKSVSVINPTTLGGLLGQVPPEGWCPADIQYVDGLDSQIIAAANNITTGLWMPWMPSEIPQSSLMVKAPLSPTKWEPDTHPIGTPHFENERDMTAIASMFLGTLFHSHGTPLLRFIYGELYLWTGVAYRTVSKDYLRNWLYRFTCSATYEKRTQSGDTITVRYLPNMISINHLVDAVLALVFAESDRIPFWLDAKENPSRPSPKATIPFIDGLLSVDHWYKNPACALIPHTPQWFAVHCLSYQYQMDATCPQFLAFLESILPGDPEAIEALQLWIGYCLIADTSQHKALLIVGPPRGGKGVLLRIIMALLGEQNVAAPSLASLAQNFGIYPLIGKLAAIIADAHAPHHLLVLILDKLKGIIGEDSMTIDRKNKDPITVKLGCRIMLATNELSAFPDPSGALAARFIVIQLRNSFLGREDRGLEPRLMTELPGILNWALAGLRKYLDQGKLIQPTSGVASLQQIRHITSPIMKFVEDMCEYPASGKSIDKEALREAYDHWARDESTDKISATQFGIKLHAACPMIKDITRGQRGKPRVKVYENITLSSEGDEFVREKRKQFMSPKQSLEVMQAERTRDDLAKTNASLTEKLQAAMKKILDLEKQRGGAP